MALVQYTARVQDERLLELPQDPALALFEQWGREDAARSAEQAAAEDRLWQEFERGVNAGRRAQGMRPLS